MILFKVVSLHKKMKAGYVAAVFLLVVMIMLIFIPLFSSEDEVVFSELTHKAVLVIVPSEASTILLEGKDFKEEERVSEKTPFIYEVGSRDWIDLIVTPNHGMPIKKSFRFEKGQMVVSEEERHWEYMIINEWPHHVYEIQIHPPKSAKADVAQQETLVKEERIDLDGNNRLEALELIRQGDYYFMKMDGREILLKGRSMSKVQWDIQDMNHDGLKEIIIYGDFGEPHQYIEIFQFQNDQVQRVFWEQGENISVHKNGSIQVGKRLFTMVDHYKTVTYQWEEEEYKKESEVINYWQGKPKWPQTPENIIKAFFEAIELGLEKEAMEYMTQEYQNETQFMKIMEGIEKDWRDISLPTYYFHGGYGQNDVFNMAFFYDTDLHEKYSRVRIYEVEGKFENSSQSPWGISDIKEVPVF